MSELKDILIDIVKPLVANPDEVVVTVDEKGRDVTLTLNVAPSDMGKVIGKRGKIAHAIRLVMKSASNLAGKRVNVEIR